jgi:putative OmpL-like beta-barrel porin-2
MIKYVLFAAANLFLILFNFIYSQESSAGLIRGLPEGLTINGYADAYIAYDSDKGSSQRSFSSIAPYRDEFRLNMALISVKYANEKVRGTISFHFGDIAKLNWPADDRYVQEANAGFSPCKNTWIDAGYFLTHIGGEGVFPVYNYFQSLSLCTFYEPFFQSGIRISYTGKKFYGALHILNGYNVLADNNKNKSAGLTLGYKPNDKIEITLNNIAGNEQPGGMPGKLRIYNNLVFKFFPAKKVDVIVCGDICYQEKSKISDSTSAAGMFSGFASVKYHISKKFSISARGEFIMDKDGIMTGVFPESDLNLSGLSATGISGAIEYDHTENFYVRLETRYLNDNKHKIFYDNSNSKTEVILSSGIQF